MKRWIAMLGLVGLVLAGIVAGQDNARAQALGMVHVTPAERAAPPNAGVTPVKTELCGRSLGGRCTKGRAACSRGTPEQCDRWKRWSDGCNACAVSFAACRQKVGRSATHTCDKCRAAHDACEAKNRAAAG